MENLTVKDEIIYLIKKEIGENMLGDYNEMYLTDLDVDHIAENLAETLTKKYKIEEKEIPFSTLSFELGYYEWLLKKDDEVIEVFGGFGEQIWPEKEENVYDFLDNTIYKSWTWEKLTPDEKNKFNNAVEFLLDQKIVIGTKLQQESIIQGVYHAFLAGVGYTDFNWREENEDNPNF